MDTFHCVSTKYPKTFSPQAKEGYVPTNNIDRLESARSPAAHKNAHKLNQYKACSCYHYLYHRENETVLSLPTNIKCCCY